MGKAIVKATITCKLCKKKFVVITNTHLFREHQITTDDYREMFPKADLMTDRMKKCRSKATKGKTYEEIHGEEVGKELKLRRSISTTKQMMDEEQRLLRKKCGKYIRTDETIKALSESKTVHGGFTYRKRAFEFYGTECMRCGNDYGDSNNTFVHHKDFVNVKSPLGNHSIENLMVLCHSCHSKLHNHLFDGQTGFVGMPKVEKGIHLILSGLKTELGLDLKDDNFKDTPKRVARAYYELFSGVRNTKEQVRDILNSKFPAENYDEMITLMGIRVYSMCPHHLLPVEYSVDVGYIPKKETGFVLGISKLGRLVEVLAKRPVLQEVFTKEIGTYLNQIDPLGVGVRVRGDHFCIKMRGAKLPESSLTTTFMSGAFKENISTRQEFFSLIQIFNSTK